jgi:hypothetical protein
MGLARPPLTEIQPAPESTAGTSPRSCAASAPVKTQAAGQHPQPIALLARLGVDIRHEHRGLVAALLQDVFARLLELSDDIGCRGRWCTPSRPRGATTHAIPDTSPRALGPLGSVVDDRWSLGEPAVRRR